MANLFDNTKAQSRSQAQANIETRDGVVKAVYTASGNSVAADVLLDGETNILRRVPNAGGGQLSAGLKVKVNFSKGSRFDAQIIGGGDASSGSMAAASPLGTATSTAEPPVADVSQHPFLTFTGDEDLPLAQTLVPGANIQHRATPSAGTGDTFTPAYFLLSSVDVLLAALPDPAAAYLPDGVTPLAEGLRVQVKSSSTAPDSLYRLDKSGAAPVWRQMGTAGTGFVPAGPVAPSNIFVISLMYVGLSMVVTFGAAQYGSDIAASVQIYEWQRSIDQGATWQGNDGSNATVFPGANSFPTGINAGTIRARVRAKNALGAVSAWTTMTTDVVYAAAPVYLQKRRCTMFFFPVSQTADTEPNTGQALRLPRGSAGVQSQWKLMSALLRLEAPNANPTTIQVYYATPGNAAFGAGTACLANGSGAATALSASGTSAFESVAPGFTGTVGTAGLASGSIIAPLWSALAAYVAGQKAPGICLEMEWEEV